MRITLLLALAVMATARMDVRNLKPEDAGLLHTAAFEDLARLHKDGLPDSELDLMSDISEIMAEYCDSDDSFCKNLAYENTLKAFHVGQRPTEIEYPSDYHPELRTSIDDVFKTMKQIDYDNLDEIVDTLEEIANEMNDIEDVNELHLTGALAAASVAKESIKLWHNVYITSKNHPLSYLKSDHSRKLQVPPNNLHSHVFCIDNPNIIDRCTIPSIVYDTASEDVTKALFYGIEMMLAVDTHSANALVAWFPITIISIVYFAIPASLIKAFILIRTYNVFSDIGPFGGGR